jgi:peptidoglycan glycosyltransferase
LKGIRQFLYFARNPISWTLGKRLFSLFLIVAFFGSSAVGDFWQITRSWASGTGPSDAMFPLSSMKTPVPSSAVPVQPASTGPSPSILPDIWKSSLFSPLVLTRSGAPVVRIDPSGPVLDPSFFPEFRDQEGDRYVTVLDNGYRIVWTVRPSLQKEVAKFVSRNRVPYGMFVAVDPPTGELLAFYGSHDGMTDNSLVTKATYPAASLFKVVTTEDALEHRKISPETNIYFHGCLYCIGPSYWRDNPRRDRLHLSVTEALGKSVNMIFAKIAIRWLTPDNLQSTADRFGFNREIPSDILFEPSSAVIPMDRDGFARSAAGFGQVVISPIHAALIAGALSNGGIMMTPHLIHSITDASGHAIYRAMSKPLMTVADPKIAWTLLAMMHSTTVHGTGRKAFLHWHYDPVLRHIEVAGKTGTLSGMHPVGHYEWFMGMAPIGKPQIAVAALSIDQGLWRIKGPDIASHGMIAYFRKPSF